MTLFIKKNSSHIHWVGRGTGTPKDRDDDVDVIGAPSRLRVIRKTETLAKIKQTRDLNIEVPMKLNETVLGVFEVFGYRS